jgi:hypothetical protein
LAKLDADEAAMASAKVITTDQSEVNQREKSQTLSQSTSAQSTGVNVIA